MAMPSRSTAAPPVKRTRRKMTEQEKIAYRRMRFLRACDSCASSKRKCHHTRREQHPAEHSTKNDALFQSMPAHQYFVQQPPEIDTAYGGLAEENIDLAFRPRTPTLYSPVEFSYHLQTKMDEISQYENSNGFPSVLEFVDDSEENDTWFSPSSDTTSTTLTLHKPQSAETLSTLLFVENCQWAGVTDSWWDGAPARVGHDSCYDLAIDALMMACWIGRRLPGATLSKLYRAMGPSLEKLHMEMSKEGAVFNDHVLTTVAALTPADAITSGHSFLVSTHLDGVASILVSQATSRQLSNVARRILAFHFCDTYVMAAVRGTASPFEGMNGIEEYCQESNLSKPAAERKLRSIGNQLCVRLPGLISLVRQACTHTPRGDTVLSALHLANELLQLQDKSAEIGFLNNVGYMLTKLPRDRNIIEHALNLKGLSSLEAGLYYWHTRTVLLRLCSRLRSAFPMTTLPDMYGLPSLAEIRQELQHHAVHIAASVPYARMCPGRKRRRLLGQSLLAVWSILQEHPDTFTCQTEEVRSWILQQLNVTLLGPTGSIVAHDLDEAAEIFAGGPLVGRYKDLYDPPVVLKP